MIAVKLSRVLLVGVSCAAVLTVSGCGKGSTTTNTTTLVSAIGVVGQADYASALGNRGGTPDSNTLSGPFGDVAIPADGSAFYIPDTGNSRVIGYNSLPTASDPSPASEFALGQAGFTSSTAASGSATVLARPDSVSVDSSAGDTTHYFVVADTSNNRILIWNTPPTVNTPPSLVVGQADFTGSAPGTTASTLQHPTAAMVAKGALFVVDQGNNRVLIWKSVASLEAAFTGGAYSGGVTPPADEVLGQPDFTTGTYPQTPTAQSMYQPTDVWTDGFALFISDTGDNRVLYWESIPTTPDAAANLVLGQSSFTFNPTSPVPSASTMNAPTGLYSDGARLFVADTNNNRVLIFDEFPISDPVSADAVIGQEDFVHNAANDDNGNATTPQDGVSEAAPTARTLKAPKGVSYYNGVLYVTDSGNNRVLLFDNLQYNGVTTTTTN